MKHQTIRDLVGTKFGNKKSEKVIDRLNHAYKNESQVEKLSGYLWAVLASI